MRALVVSCVLASVASAGPPKKHDPGAVVLLLDRSGSMQGPKLDAAKAAAIAAVDALDARDQLAVLAFDSEAMVVARPSRDHARLKSDISRLQAGGGTDLCPGLKLALDVLDSLDAKAKHVILVTDGESREECVPDWLRAANDKHVTLSAIGVAGADESLVHKLADGGHGRLYLVDELAKLPGLVQADLRFALP